MVTIFRWSKIVEINGYFRLYHANCLPVLRRNGSDRLSSAIDACDSASIVLYRTRGVERLRHNRPCGLVIQPGNSARSIPLSMRGATNGQSLSRAEIRLAEAIRVILPMERHDKRLPMLKTLMGCRGSKPLPRFNHFPLTDRVRLSYDQIGISGATSICDLSSNEGKALRTS